MTEEKETSVPAARGAPSIFRSLPLTTLTRVRICSPYYSPWPLAALMLADAPWPHGCGANLWLRDSLSERFMTSCFLPATARRVLAMEGEVRSKEDFFRRTVTSAAFRSQPFTQLKPFERLFRGDAVSKREDADDEPGHGTRDEVERSSWHQWNRPSHGGRNNASASP